MARARRICKCTGCDRCNGIKRGCGRVAVQRGWCSLCLRAYDAGRGTRHQRGYGSQHDADRERLLGAYRLAVAQGIVPICWRCQLPMLPGQPLAADHSTTAAAAGGRADCLVHLDPCNSGKRLPGA